MKWNELSNNAKGVIEWVEDVYTGKHDLIELTVGEPFVKFGVNIMITDSLLDEIVNFVTEDKQIDILWLNNQSIGFRACKNFKLA